MTRSQMWAYIGLTATTLSAILAGLAPYVPLMPPKVQIGIGIAGAVVGGIVSTRNQSTSRDHVSVPAEEVTPEGLTRQGLRKVLRQVGEQVGR